MFKHCCGCKGNPPKKQKAATLKPDPTVGATDNELPLADVKAVQDRADGKLPEIKAFEPSPKPKKEVDAAPPKEEPDVTAESAPPVEQEEERKCESAVKCEKSPAKAAVPVEEVAEEQVKSVPEEKPVAPSVEVPAEEEEDEPVDEDVAAALRAMVPTPHPAKRSGSVPGLGALPQWLSQDDDEVFEGGGEPPATPVGRDELALRRHRFFSDLLGVAKAGVEHRVRFDPLGPTVAGSGEADTRPSTVEFETLVNRLESVTTRLEKTVVATELALKPILQPNMSVTAFTDIVQGPLASYLQLSGKIGGDVASHANLVSQAFQAQLQYLSRAAQSKAPSQAENVQLLEPTSTQIQAIQEFREKHRGSNFFFHLSAVSESIAALGWVTVSPAPAPYIKEMNDASQFYTNRVLKEWKEKDKIHVDWVKAWGQTLTDLQKFVKQHHTTGLVWGGGKGGVGIPPPPPGLPPPPPVLPQGDVAPILDNSAQDRSALFAEINKGESITSSLKRVTPDMQTHKNTALRSGPAPFKAPTTGTRSVGAPVVTDKPPSFVKDGKKWMVEYQKGNHSLVVENAEMNNVVYMFKCQDSTLTVKGKINSIVLDSCRKSSVVFDSLVSSVEFVNCQSIQMQVLGKVPTITIDKTDGCQMYLSPESLDAEIVSSKSSEMNVMVPKGNGDYGEFAVPEQYKTTISKTGLVTIAVENKG